MTTALAVIIFAAFWALLSALPLVAAILRADRLPEPERTEYLDALTRAMAEAQARHPHFF
jgi:hypothetical protein